MFDINKQILFKEVITPPSIDYSQETIGILQQSWKKISKSNIVLVFGSIMVIFIFFLSFSPSPSLNILNFSHANTCILKRINFSPKSHSNIPGSFLLKPHSYMVCYHFFTLGIFLPKSQIDIFSSDDKPPRLFLTLCCYPSWGTNVNRTQIVCLHFYVKTPIYNNFLMLFCFPDLRYVFFSGTSTKASSPKPHLSAFLFLFPKKAKYLRLEYLKKFFGKTYDELLQNFWAHLTKLFHRKKQNKTLQKFATPKIIIDTCWSLFIIQTMTPQEIYTYLTFFLTFQEKTSPLLSFILSLRASRCPYYE